MIKIDTLLESRIDATMFEPFLIDCTKCCGLCCVALYFSRAEGFPKDKDAGIPCGHLQRDYQCTIHGGLSERGLKGCMAYDCFGAGQRVTGSLTVLPDWETIPPKEAGKIFDSFLAVMQIHQVLWYLTAASTLHLQKPIKDQISMLIKQGNQLAGQPGLTPANGEIAAFRETSNGLLKKICAGLTDRYSAHGASRSRQKNHMGKNYRQKNLTRMDFSMGLLIAADLEQADLTGANFLGADMRDANIRNTDLSQSLFLTQIQVNGAKGNQHTILPPYLSKPASWQAGPKGVGL